MDFSRMHIGILDFLMSLCWQDKAGAKTLTDDYLQQHIYREFRNLISELLQTANGA
jgi:hypothetical protein